jgi:hypothetical protein
MSVWFSELTFKNLPSSGTKMASNYDVHSTPPDNGYMVANFFKGVSYIHIHPKIKLNCVRIRFLRWDI